ncbi:DUF262 domain-containing protein [Leclercia adecarboxylata]|jgi:hypothetical protein|uniref:GmrSD restriction endonuclease domain-containing protein n=1 Tax=Leclercia adecarboxylata TaxID=83655 RepID=UPI00194F3D59|nr:DUF262 domain-containing protein [Leclercia adecarboxylata]MBM6637015.1 DUF262 domain-containing protein [Leclercia adecarboxylata]
MDDKKNLKASLDSLQQKAKERTVKTQQSEYDLESLVKRIKKGSIKLDPDYQRRHRWDEETSSRLIESLILNIPIPVIFISQDIDVDEEVEEATARFTVIDGQQRLTAITDFFSNKFALAGLEVLPELNGIFYKDLPSFLIRRLEERTIKCLRIDSTVDSQVKYDIFERLNTGSVKLESQELRNAVARGPFNDLIKELGQDPVFRQLIGVSDKDANENTKIKKMEDAELVLRFFALRGKGYHQLRKGFKDFLTTSLVAFNKKTPSQIDEARSEFKNYINFIKKNFGPLPFSKYRSTADGLKKMSNFNAAVYDAILVGFAEVFKVDQLMHEEGEVLSAIKDYRNIFYDTEFFNSVSGSVNDIGKVSYRIEAFEGFLNDKNSPLRSFGKHS